MIKRFIPSSTNPAVGNIVSRIVSSFSSEITRDADIGVDLIKDYDITEFISDVKTIYKKHNELTKEFEGFSFLPENVAKTVDEKEEDHIRFQLLKRTFGTFQQQPTPHNGIRAIKPILVDIIDDTKHPGYKVLVYSQLFDNSIEFTSWSQNYRDAVRGAELTEAFFTLYEPIFKLKGLQILRYIERGTDQIRESGTYVYYGSPVRYYVRTNKISLLYEKTLETLVIETLLTN